jgi:hypothetical protein
MRTDDYLAIMRSLHVLNAQELDSGAELVTLPNLNEFSLKSLDV